MKSKFDTTSTHNISSHSSQIIHQSLFHHATAREQHQQWKKQTETMYKWTDMLTTVAIVRALYRVVLKKRYPNFIFAITSVNVHRFLQFFHC